MSKNFKTYYYDKDINKVTCYSYPDFIKTLASFQRKGSPISVNDSLFLSNFHIMREDGSTCHYYKWYELFPKMEADFGIPVKPRHFSNFCGSSTYVMMLDDSVQVNIDTDKLEDIGAVVSEEISLEKEEVIVEVAVTEVTTEEESVTQDDKVDIDYDVLNAFFNEEDLKGSKTALESYVQATYNIDLNKRLSFSNMIAQLENELN